LGHPDYENGYLNLHDYYLGWHKSGFVTAAEQWDSEGRFDYRYEWDAQIDGFGEERRGFWDGYMAFKKLMCQQKVRPGLTPFILSLPTLQWFEPSPIERDASTTLVVFEWHDREATDARAAYTTGERQEDLVEWQTHNASGSRPSIEVISPEEACDMATRLVCYNLIVRNGEPSPPVGGSGWTMQFSLPKSKYYMDLGASDECQVVLNKIRHSLDDDHLAPVDYVLKQVASRKTSGPSVERSPAPASLQLDARDMILLLEWNSHNSQETWSVALATPSRKDELVEWQKQISSVGNSPIAVISTREATAVVSSVIAADVVMREGDPPHWIGGEGWVLRIATGERTYYVDLGVSEGVLDLLHNVRDRLLDGHELVMDRAIECTLQVQLRTANSRRTEGGLGGTSVPADLRKNEGTPVQ
jgi:hypothetical protein